LRVFSKVIAPDPIPDRLIRRQTAPADSNRYKIVSVRLRAAEFDEFAKQVSAFGLTHSLALRIVIRRIGGFLEADSETRLKLAEILRAIGAVSDNLSKLDKSCRQEGFDMERFTQQRQEFGMEFAQLDALLRSVLNVSQRLKDAML
jgi:type IV secretion system T-DNA border endonuclease VirD1